MKKMNSDSIIDVCGFIYIGVVFPYCIVNSVFWLPHLLYILFIIIVIIIRKFHTGPNKVDKYSFLDSTLESDNSPSVENEQAIPANGSEEKSEGQQDKESSSVEKTFSEIVKEIANKPGSTIYKCNVLDVLVEPQEEYIRYRFFVDRDIRVYDSSGVEKTTRQVFTSNNAICLLLKQYEDLYWLSMAIMDDYCIPLDVKRLLIGSTIEILQENVLKGSLYTNPFTNKSDAYKIEHNIFINRIIAINLCDTAEQYLNEYVTKILEEAIEPCKINKKIAEFVAACEEANIDHIQSLYDSCPRVATHGEDTVDCTKKFQEVITRQVDKLESFIDETDIAKIQQIKESFFDKATDATRKKFALEFQRAEEILSEFEAEYGSGVPIMDISTEVNYSLKSTLDHKYPYRKVPVLGTRIFPYRRQRALRKGVSEEKFYKLICKYLSFPGFIILDDVSLHINEGLAIEPDIAIIINRKKNIRIDVEIDEPYSGYDHKPIHYIGCGDEIRDDNLAKLGWITLRFAEEQVVGSPLCVIAEILRIINMIDYDSYSGQRLNAEIAKRGEKLIRISRWTKDEAIEMAEKRYREEYLNLSAFGEVLIQLPQEYHQTIAEKKALEGVSLSSTNSGVLVNKEACSISEAFIQKKEVPPCESILEGKDKVDVTSQEYSMAQPVNLASIIDRPVPGKRKREELPYFSIRPKSVSTTELIQYYFPLKSAEVSGSDIITEESLNTELYDFYKRRVDKSYSAEFLILQEYLKDNDIHPRNVFMRLYDPKYNVSGSISFIYDDALYSCRLKSIGIPDSERGRGIAAGLENIPRNRIDAEETMKALILSERYNMSVKQIYIIEIDPKSMSINKRKAMPQTTGKNILFGDYWDQVKQIKDGNN